MWVLYNKTRYGKYMYAIGGVSTAGGEGTVPGILLVVFVFELLKVALAYLGISPDVTNIIQGIIIIAAVALDVRKTMERKII